jgi:hypothetical protein
MPHDGAHSNWASLDGKAVVKLSPKPYNPRPLESARYRGRLARRLYGERIAEREALAELRLKDGAAARAKVGFVVVRCRRATTRRTPSSTHS